MTTEKLIEITPNRNSKNYPKRMEGRAKRTQFQGALGNEENETEEWVRKGSSAKVLKRRWG